MTQRSTGRNVSLAFQRLSDGRWVYLEFVGANVCLQKEFKQNKTSFPQYAIQKPLMSVTEAFRHSFHAWLLQMIKSLQEEKEFKRQIHWES